MTEFEKARLENVLQMYATTEWRCPMPAAGLLYHEILRLRAEEAPLRARLLASEIMGAEINASLNYELSKSFWQRLKDLFA